MPNPGVKGCGCGAGAPPLGNIPPSPIPPPQPGSSYSSPPPPAPSGSLKGLSAEGSKTASVTLAPGPSTTERKRKPSLATQEREAKEEALKKWVSPLRQFDTFAVGELRRREIAEEDFPRLKVPAMKGQHKCKVQSLMNHQVDYAFELEQDLRNIGIQETRMLDMLDKLTKAEAACRFQGAVRAAEVAAMSAPPELAEEAAVAGARGYTVETQDFSKKSSPGENPIEIVGYIGCTRPNNF